ncbi:hypothetical protein [Gallaecimonas mangrovi]|uniref:hypothetical protein n=1 Tax=Gallaecimonas mangrovi TaxID=2291597 RepID=UPI000E20B1AC|nr:hypothetical protein [Gallaecimonas mangrovi]
MSKAAAPELILDVTFRIEPGCLGPDGLSHIEDFCQLAQQHFDRLARRYLRWDIIPRYDKALPEMQYSLNGRAISRDKVEKVLNLHQQTVDGLEEKVNQLLDTMINLYFERN